MMISSRLFAGHPASCACRFDIPGTPFRLSARWSCLVTGLTEQLLQNGAEWAITRVIAGV
jgi:hypothetical protein